MERGRERRPLPLSSTRSARFAGRFFSPYSPLRSLVPGYRVSAAKDPCKLRNMFPQQCFPVCARKKHLLREQNVSEKVLKYFLLLERKRCFRNKCFWLAQTGKHSLQAGQQCSRKNVSSFAAKDLSHTVEALLTDTRVSGQLYLRPP